MTRHTVLADEMLGKLARDLRALGVDTLYQRDMDDDDLLALALDEDRWLVTRDHQLARRAGGHGVLVASRDPGEQLDQVLDELDLAVGPERFLTRCLECNDALVAVEAPDEVPAGVEDEQHWRCPACKRVYWHGTHVDDMRERLARFL